MKYFVLAMLLLIKVNAEYPKFGHHCEDNDHCLDGWEYCNMQTKLCAHKSTWPLFGIEWFGFILMTFWILGCVMAGTSGGGSLIPLLRIIFLFTVKDAIAISNLTIAVVGIISFITTYTVKHPLKVDTKGKPAGLAFEYNLAVML